MKKTELFLQAYSDSLGNLSAACNKVGITRLQVIPKAQRDESFASRIWEINESVIDLAIQCQLKLGLTGDRGALKDWLSVHAPHRGYSGGDDTKKDKNYFLPPVMDEHDKIKKQISKMPTKIIEQMLINIDK